MSVSTAQPARRVAAFDGLRALAFLAVFATHTFVHGTEAGWIGVDVFFVLSGYLITGILLRGIDEGRGIPLRQFWIRRLARLYPALVLGVVLAEVLYLWHPVPAVGNRPIWALAALVYATDFYTAATGKISGLFVPTWTLAIEEQFYLVWPLVLLLIPTAVRMRRWALGAGIASLAAAFALGHPIGTITAPASTLPVTRAWELLAGCVLAGYLHQREPGRRLVLACSVIGPVALLGVLATPFLVPGLTHEYFVQALIAVAGGLAMVVATRRPDSRLGRVLSIRPLPGLGRISYGAYLYHYPILVVVSSVLATWWYPGVIAFCLVLTIGLAWASFRWVESPILARTTRPDRARPTAPAAELATVLGPSESA